MGQDGTADRHYHGVGGVVGGSDAAGASALRFDAQRAVEVERVALRGGVDHIDAGTAICCCIDRCLGERERTTAGNHRTRTCGATGLNRQRPANTDRCCVLYVDAVGRCATRGDASAARQRDF